MTIIPTSEPSAGLERPFGHEQVSTSATPTTLAEGVVFLVPSEEDEGADVALPGLVEFNRPLTLCNWGSVDATVTLWIVTEGTDDLTVPSRQRRLYKDLPIRVNETLELPIQGHLLRRSTAVVGQRGDRLLIRASSGALVSAYGALTEREQLAHAPYEELGG